MENDPEWIKELHVKYNEQAAQAERRSNRMKHYDKYGLLYLAIVIVLIIGAALIIFNK